MTTSKLLEPYQLGPLTLPNRLVMAPLTRNRATPPGMVPSPLAIDYYGQRASAGLLVTEATQVSQQGQGYQDTPGIYSKEQVQGWRKVTERVHANGGRIFNQIWHVGRVSHTSLQPGGGKPVAPSAIPAKGKTFVNNRSPKSPSRARWSCPKFPGSSRLQTRCGERARRRLRRRGDSRRQRLSARPVCQGRRQPANRCLRRVDREPREVDAGGLEGGRRGSGRGANRHPHLAGDASQRRHAIAIRSRCSIISSTGWKR